MGHNARFLGGSLELLGNCRSGRTGLWSEIAITPYWNKGTEGRSLSSNKGKKRTVEKKEHCSEEGLDLLCGSNIFYLYEQ